MRFTKLKLLFYGENILGLYAFSVISVSQEFKIVESLLFFPVRHLFMKSRDVDGPGRVNVLRAEAVEALADVFHDGVRGAG